MATVVKIPIFAIFIIEFFGGAIMIKLNFEKYRDKVNACWLGKNIGGTMGTPYEGTTEYLDIKGFVTKKGEVLPNDDLDLQLIWLLALERDGAKKINAALLGEYWLSYIVPYWNEYGIGKANMRRGLAAPLSGDFENSWRDSNGAWIRTEIWACVTPGNAGAAAKYAIEDAKVDHGVGEGTYAAAFVAAMQSAAFIFSDIRKCIDIGLAGIPEDCRVAKSVKFVIDAYDKGMNERDTRNAVQQMNADIGNGWFEAPSNIAYTVLGLIFGEGDFKKSMIAAINCGDDTDCTGATVGATLGILNGMAGIPEDWREYLGDDIITLSLNRASSARNLPKTCTELTERVVRVAPGALFNNFEINIDKNKSDVSITWGEEYIPEDVYDIEMYLVKRTKKSLDRIKLYSLEFEAFAYRAIITLPDGPRIAPGGDVRVQVSFLNKYHDHDDALYTLSLSWITPDGFEVIGGEKSLMLTNWTSHSMDLLATTEVVIKAEDAVASKNRIVLEVECDGRPSVLYCPITLLG